MFSFPTTVAATLVVNGRTLTAAAATAACTVATPTDLGSNISLQLTDLTAQLANDVHGRLNDNSVLFLLP